jgi:hypothetical protein
MKKEGYSMKLQKIGGVGSIGSAFLAAIYLVFFLLVFPSLGLVGPSDWIDPTKCIAAWSASPITFFLLNLGFILLSIAFIMIVLALRDRMQASAPNLMRIAVIGVSISCALWLAGGLIGIIGMPSIVSAKDASAYRAVMGVYLGLSIAADHALGWVLLLIGWAAVKTSGLPRILSYLSVLVGIVGILEFAVQPFMFVFLFLGIIWGLWLGVVLLRSKA